MTTRGVYAYQPYQDRRQLVQELRLAAVKASTGRFHSQPKPQLLQPSPSPSPSHSNPYSNSSSPYASPLSISSLDLNQGVPEDPWPKPVSSRSAPNGPQFSPPLHNFPSALSAPTPTPTAEKPPVLGMNLVNSSVPLETQLNRLEHAAQGGGSGVVLSNTTYREMKVMHGGGEKSPAGEGVEEYHHHHHHHHHHYHDSILSKTKRKGKQGKGRSRRASEVLKQVSRQREHRHDLVSPTKAQPFVREDEVEDDDDSRFDEEEDDHHAQDFEDGVEVDEPNDEAPQETAENERFGDKKMDRETLEATLIAQVVQAECVEAGMNTLRPLGDVLEEAKALDVAGSVGSVEDVRGKAVVARSGYLMKAPPAGRIGKRGKWRKRFFKLSGRVLTYFAEEDSALPKAMIDLRSIVVQTDSEALGTTPFPHAVLLRDESSDNPRSFRICAESHEEIFAWYKGIVTNAALLAVQSMETKSPMTHKIADFYPLYRKPPSHYDLLRVQPDASSGTIKKSYRKLAMEFHPDRNPEADPKEFSAISQAYDILVDPESREDYDMAEKIKDVLRRGFEAILYLPKRMTYDPKSNRSYPAQLASKQVLIFCDGNLKHLYYQEVEEESPETRFQVRSKQSFELRLFQRVIFGRNDIVMASAFGSPSLEQDKRLVLHGAKLKHDVYLELDTHQACKELLEGLRIIRCGKSAVFAQQLAKWQEKGYD